MIKQPEIIEQVVVVKQAILITYLYLIQSYKVVIKITLLKSIRVPKRKADQISHNTHNIQFCYMDW